MTSKYIARIVFQSGPDLTDINTPLKISIEFESPDDFYDEDAPAHAVATQIFQTKIQETVTEYIESIDSDATVEHIILGEGEELPYPEEEEEDAEEWSPLTEKENTKH